VAYFFWPIPLPDEEGKVNAWHQASLDIVSANRVEWIKLKAITEASNYLVKKPISTLETPVWDIKTETALGIALTSQAITSVSHPLIKRLLGAI
jgi:hypothetical protein